MINKELIARVGALLQRLEADRAQAVTFQDGLSVADLRALLTAAQGQEWWDETGWLIETGDPPKWWTGWPGSAADAEFWTTDSDAAIRFARQRDAEEFARLNMGDGDYTITEHAWNMPRIR